MDIIKNCKLCGKTYVGHSMASMYCSDECRRLVENARKRKIGNRAVKTPSGATVSDDNLVDVQQVLQIANEYMTLNELAILLRVSHATAFRYVTLGIIKGTKVGRNILVRKADLDAMFENAPAYKKRKYKRRQEANQYYTVREIVEKFHICKKAVLARCDKFNIPKEYEGRNVFFNRTAVDVHFAELIEEIDLANYYTIQQVMEKYNMTKPNALTFISHHQIPRVTRGRTVYYSRVHIDSFKRKGDGIDVNWYSYAEIIENYGLTKDQISYYIKHEHLKTEKRGKFTMIFRSDFDQKVVKVRFANNERDENGKLIINTDEPQEPVSSPAHRVDKTPETPEGYYSTEEISKKFAISVRQVNKLGRVHKLPKISLRHFNFFEIGPVDELFAQKNQYADVQEWISPEQMKQIYSMTGDACRSFIYRHKIPAKVEYGNTFYSKDHIDRVKGLVFDGMENYYSISDASERYNLSKDRVFYYAKQYKVSKVKCGQFVFLLKDEFDKVMRKCHIKTKK